ncbi:histone deacetylase 6-like [Etheostoma cragini]|uniref:histone deacetylase 6-like n=1 Tax=Etheostoma cragini TaxID=417921 RepID=UPI00155EC86F|nr:histone deacetylase 6-like [Etheostoma cragini]
MSLAGGRVLLILEGGYNLSSISDSMAMCTSVLLGDPPPSLVTPLPPPHHSAVATIHSVLRHHAPYWRSLRIHLPESVRTSLPSLKHRGKRSSKGKGRKSEPSGTDKPPLPPTGVEDTTTERGLEQLTQGLASLDISQANRTSATSTPVGGARPKVRLILTCEEEVKTESGDVKAEPGDVKAESGDVKAEPGDVKAEPGDVKAEPGNVKAEPGNVKAEPGDVKAEPGDVKAEPGDVKAEPMGIGAGPWDMKAGPVDREAEAGDVKAESMDVTPELSQSAESTLPQPQAVAVAASEPVAPGDSSAGGAGAEPETEGACGWSKPKTSLELTCGGQTDTPLYVVDPLSWCPHLDAVKPLPPTGINVFQPCEDCGSDTENWTCLTCYQVTCPSLPSPCLPLSPPFSPLTT